MDNPTHYDNVCQEALNARDKYNLTHTQTLLYNHICRGDFKLRNDDGQKFYDKKNNGFGWSGNREWVKRQFQPLMKAGLVSFKSVHDCRDPRYVSWYFYDSRYEIDELIDASCYVSAHKWALIKHYCGIPDNISKKKKSQTFGDLELIYDKSKKGRPYTFKFKGEGSIYSWDHNGEGKKQDLTWLTKKFTWDKPLYYESIQAMVHDIWSFLANSGHEYKNKIPGYTIKRAFTLEDYGVSYEESNKKELQEIEKERKQTPNSFSFKFNIQRDIAHIFLNDEYINTYILSSDMFEKRSVKDRIEGVFLKRVFNSSKYGYKNIFNNHNKEKNVTVLEYLVTKDKKTPNQMLFEKFEEKGRWFSSNFFKNYSIYKIYHDKIRTSCWDAGYREEYAFNAQMVEQAKALEEYIEKTFGVKIKISNIPTYKDRQDKTIYFNYKVIKVVDESKLKLEKTEEIDIINRIDEFTSWREYTSKEDEEKEDVLKLQPTSEEVSLYEATSDMFRSPKYMYIIKKYEKELLEDFENYKEYLLGRISGEITFEEMCIRMLNNFRKLMPELYLKMFNHLPPGLIVGTLAKYELKSEKLEEVIYKFKTPEVI